MHLLFTAKALSVSLVREDRGFEGSEESLYALCKVPDNIFLTLQYGPVK